MRPLARAVAAAFLLAPRLALADPPPAPASEPPAAAAPAPDDEAGRKGRARELFEAGLRLSSEGAWDAALADFARSRELFPSRPATKNAAICLGKLHRFDEAIEMFEAFLAYADVPPADRQFAEAEIKALNVNVGAIEVRGFEVGATVVVDGRDRGATPLARAVRVAAGTHVVRVYKRGFEAIEKKIEVAGGMATVVQAELVALRESGTLTITEQTGKRLSVLIDNVLVGTAPWEGPLAPGEHAIALRGEGDLGTQPVTAPVRVGQTTALTLLAEELTATLRVEPSPAGATVAVDGVSVGRGVWEGRLRAGKHRVEVATDGFVAAARDVSIPAQQRETVAVGLARDPESPLWGTSRPRFQLEAVGAFLASPSLGGQPASACSGACSRGVALGGLVEARGTYRFRSGFMLGVEVGYVALSEATAGRATTVNPPGLAPNQGTAADAVRIRGLAVGACAGMELGAASFPVVLRLGVGPLLGSVTDHRTGKFTTVPDALSPKPQGYAVDVTESGALRMVYVAPEIRVGRRFGEHLVLSAGLRALFLVGLGAPAWDQGLGVVETPPRTNGQATFAAGPLLGRVIVGFAPLLGARYDF